MFHLGLPYMQEYIVFLSSHWMLSVSFIVLSAMLAWTFIAPSIRNYKELNPAAAIVLINNDDALILDVRSENEFIEGHIVRAINLPLHVLDNRISEFDSHKSKPVLVVCRSGSRSAQACGKLSKQGFTDVTNLGGGIMAWQHANYPVKKGKK